MSNKLFRKKTITFEHNVSGHSKLKKTLGAFDLFAIGLGTVIGTGIFVLTGIHAAQTAGPAVTISFAIAGLTCVFVALVYTEVASALPSSGGSYTYAYVAIGELAAWIVGILAIGQFFAGCTAVAAGWSGYVMGVLKQLNINVPYALTHNPFDGGVVDLPAIFIVLLITLILIKGIKESITLNTILVFVKIAAIFIFLGVAVPHFNIENWSNFMPFGVSGVTLAAGSLFIAYTGFDAIANATEESKNPERDVTIGLIGSIVVSMLLYVAVAGMLTGITHYTNLNNAEPLAYALKVNGSNVGGAIVAAGGIAGMTTVILFQLYAASRVAMTMSRDGLLPEFFSKIHSKFSTPHVATIIIGGLIAVCSGFLPIKIMADLVGICSLSVVVSVIISGLKLRKSKPTMKRPFRCPMIYVVATISLASCSYLIATLLQTVGLIFIAFIILSVIVYFTYSRKRATKVYIKNH
jgi:basic amino acid/polyamine antiporter, APA family